jgi:hypothetical protein
METSGKSLTFPCPQEYERTMESLFIPAVPTVATVVQKISVNPINPFYQRSISFQKNQRLQ